MGTGPTVTVGIEKWYPTKKWFGALASGVALLVIHTIASGGWDTTEEGELTLLVTALAGAYITRNDKTLEGKIPA